MMHMATEIDLLFSIPCLCMSWRMRECEFTMNYAISFPKEKIYLCKMR
jgi:hypothetical protein